MTEFSLFSPHGDFEEISAAVRLAEEVGFDGALFGEHHGAPQNRFPQLLPLVAALAARTSRIRLGTSILLSPLYDPVHLAETAAEVDQISGGRLILGLGLGYQAQDFAHFGIPMGERVSRFEEGIEVLRRAWSDRPLSFHGKRYRYDNAAVFPKPLQQPGPPVWLAAWSDAGAARAGRLGDAYVTDPIQGLDAIKRFCGIYGESADAAGRPPRVVVMREFLCAPTRAEARDRYERGLLLTYRYYWRNGGFNVDVEPALKDVTSEDDLSFERMVADRVIWGSPDDCAGQLEQWIQATGAEHVQLTFPPDLAAGASQEAQLAAIRLAGERVVARLR